ncbi:unnamed protein product, partial [Amoebophrya sp. A25]|eukprot:GSA25T00025193001.1
MDPIGAAADEKTNSGLYMVFNDLRRIIPAKRHRAFKGLTAKQILKTRQDFFSITRTRPGRDPSLYSGEADALDVHSETRDDDQEEAGGAAGNE